VDGLGVASRTSSFGYKGSQLGTADIARALKVNHVLEGSVRKSGNSVRITAQLIDAVNDRHLWSETYDRELTDIFAIQEEIANAIVHALSVHLGRAKAAASVTVRADTENLQAYELYLKARELFIARKDLRESIRLFEQATQMDPNFARGWEGLAAVSSVAPSWGVQDRDYLTLAKAAARRALELDASLSMPWAVLANVAQASAPVDWAANFELLDRAIAVDARNSTAYLWRGIAWLHLGFFGRAISDFDQCLELEPQYRNALRHKSLALLYSGQTDAAFDLFEQGVAAGFVTALAENFVAPLVARRNLLAAQLLLDDMGFAPDMRHLLLGALQRPRPPGKDATTLVERYFVATDNPDLLALGTSHPYLWLGDFDKAGSMQDKLMTHAAWDRLPAGYRNSPGFKHRLVRIGAVDYWRKHGFPPQCRPAGATDFTCD
jgi:tetratricopeptide (TPR) repeat protein